MTIELWLEQSIRMTYYGMGFMLLGFFCTIGGLAWMAWRS